MKNEKMKKFFEALHRIQMKAIQLENNQTPFSTIEKNGVKMVVANN